MKTRRLVAAVLLVTATVGSAGCTGQNSASSCPPVAGTVTTPLADDRGVLSAKVWLPVVTSKGQYVSWLEPLNVASRSLTTVELEDILSAKGQDRDAAVMAAIADIPRAVVEAVPDTLPRPGQPTPTPQPQPTGRAYQLLVPSSAVGKAVGAFYAAALERQGHAVTSTTLSKDDAIGTVNKGKAGQVALLELPDLAGALGALLPSTGLSGQVRAAATVAAERSLALGTPTSANRTPQVLVTHDFAVSHGNLSDLSGLAQACPGLAVTATENTVESLAPLTAAYGLGTAVADRDAVDRVRTGETVAALAPAVHHAG